MSNGWSFNAHLHATIPELMFSYIKKKKIIIKKRSVYTHITVRSDFHFNASHTRDYQQQSIERILSRSFFFCSVPVRY